MHEVLRPLWAHRSSRPPFILLLFCPPPFSKGLLFAFLRPTAIVFRSPCPILAKSNLCICSIVKVNLRYCCLDEGPDTPVKPRHSPKCIDFLEKPGSQAIARHQTSMRCIALYVFLDECSAHWPCGEDAKVARKSTPFREVVCYVEGRGRWYRVFVVNEGDGLDFGVLFYRCAWLDNHVAAKEIGMAEHKLGWWVSNEARGERSRKGWKRRTPFPPSPGKSPRTEAVLSSSFCSMSLRFVSASLSVGRAKIHFCIIVQTFGVGFRGVIAFMVSNEGNDFGTEV